MKLNKLDVSLSILHIGPNWFTSFDYVSESILINQRRVRTNMIPSSIIEIGKYGNSEFLDFTVPKDTLYNKN